MGGEVSRVKLIMYESRCGEDVGKVTEGETSKRIKNNDGEKYAL